MNTFILLCAAMLAADDSAQVRVKVLYGTAEEKQQRADIELWISQAVEKAGSPLAQPHTSWISLTGKLQRLYTSPSGGFIIDGRATEKDGSYEVEIEACAGLCLDKKVTLKSGERRVINLNENKSPNNVFLAFEAPLSEQAKKRAEAMKTNVKSFSLELNYNGQERKPFYRLVISVPEVEIDRSSPFNRIVQIKEAEANVIIDYLARDGFFDQAVDLRNKTKQPTPTMPGYTMTATTDDLPLIEDIGWGLPMIQRLDALRNVFPDNGQRDMDLLLGRLSGLRAQWQTEARTDPKGKP